MGATDVDYFYLDRIDQKRLVEILAVVPTLVSGLEVAIMRQERMGTGGPRIGKVERAQPLPFNEHASNAATALHAELSTWVRFVCEPRGTRFWPADYTHEYGFIGPLRKHERRLPCRSADYRASTVDLARWLDRNVAALALTPGSEESLSAITRSIKRAFSALRAPKPDHVYTPISMQVSEARKLELNARAASTMAKTMGDQYSTLTKRRVLYLREIGMLDPVRYSIAGKIRIPIFHLGSVLDAHLNEMTRATA